MLVVAWPQQAASWAVLPPDACVVWAATAVQVRAPFSRQGSAFFALVPSTTTLSDTPAAPDRSPYILCEDNTIIGHAHTDHASIRQLGAGRFSNWSGALYFSASDNTDPNTNGREYRLVRDPSGTAAISTPMIEAAIEVHSDTGAAGSACSNQQTADAHTAAHYRGHSAHANDSIKADEHAAALELVRDCAVTDAATQSGAWSNPQTWRDGRIPANDARVLIPENIVVEVDGIGDTTELDWVRVDGRMRFAADRNTALALRTLVVSEHGRLEIGTDGARVRADVSAKLHFAPRRGRDHAGDPYDLAGGLISHGTVQMFGAARTPHRATHQILTRATARLAFPEPVSGWRTGDTLLIPGTDAWSDQDELRTISTVSDDGRVVELDHALRFDHRAPANVPIWIGNLTRNIEIRSIQAEPLADRGHVMFMHTQTGTVLDGAAFVDLGRTDTRVGHTVPQVGANGSTLPGTDANTIGRYPVHFHVRSGANRETPPQVVRDCVVINSPKFGIVNHGGNVLAEGNVTFRIAGSHLVGENGSEIGAFRHNMAVRSSGSGDPSILSRMGIYDNAHGGNGIWLTSGGIDVTDNWASGHADSGFKMLAMAFFDQGQEVFFDGKNIGNPNYADRDGHVALMDVNLHLARNFFLASQHGIEIWNHKELTQHSEQSVIEDTSVWNVQFDAIFLPYTRNTILRNLRLVGTGTSAGIDGNRATGNITLERGRIEGFGVGARLPQRGVNVVRGTMFDNAVDIEIQSPSVPGRRIQLDAPAFHSPDRPGRVTIAMRDVAMPFSGDAAILFADDRIDLTDRLGANQRLYFPQQAGEAVVFEDRGPLELHGLTNADIERRFGLALGGGLVPPAGRKLPLSNALAAASTLPDPTELSQDSQAADVGVGLESIYGNHTASKEQTSATRVGSGWTAVKAKFDSFDTNAAAHGESDHPAFMLQPSLLPLQIHPDDVSFGYRTLGYRVDTSDDRIRLVSYFEEFHDLKVDADGFVRVTSKVATDEATGAPQVLAIRVTADAVRRGPNLDFFLQRQYCGSCGMDRLDSDAARLLAARARSPMFALGSSVVRWSARQIERWWSYSRAIFPTFGVA
jgi:hypothetical protein